MVIGAFYLTEFVEGSKGEGRVFRHTWEAIKAYDAGHLSLHAEIEMRPATGEKYRSTLGRVLFEEALPSDFMERFGHVDTVLRKRELGVIVEQLSDNYSNAEVAASLDGIKNISYRFASQSGLTVSIDDVRTPDTKKAILEDHESQAEKVEQQFRALSRPWDEVWSSGQLCHRSRTPDTRLLHTG